jgi:hypothetical protein
MTTLKTLGLAVLLAFTAAEPVVAADPPGREFTGTAVVNSRQGSRRMPMTLVANRFTSVEEAQQLAELLEQGGQGTLLSALRGRGDGELRLGAMSLPIALVVVEETSRGHRYVFLTPRRIQIEERQLGSDSLDYPFGVAVFEIEGFNGRGEGTLHVAAALSIDSSGHVDIEDYDGEDGRFEGLRRVR